MISGLVSRLQRTGPAQPDIRTHHPENPCRIKECCHLPMSKVPLDIMSAGATNKYCSLKNFMKLHQYELVVVNADETEDGYVILAHGQRYSLRLSNDRSSRCDVEVSIDGNHVGTFRLNAKTSSVIERPVSDDGFFTFYELVTEEARRAGITSNDQTGLITAIFKPEAMALYASPLPGGTGLSGHSKQEFTSVAALHYSAPEDFVTINLRLGGAPADIRPLVKRQMSTPVPPPLT